jgi:hypothetical protein
VQKTAATAVVKGQFANITAGSGLTELQQYGGCGGGGAVTREKG